MDADWHAFCQAIYKGIEGSEWEELYFHYRAMSKAAGARQPSESQKAKALWAIKAAKDRGKHFYDPARKEIILGRNQTRLELWGEHLKDPITALEKALKRLEKKVSGLSGGVVFIGLRPRGLRHGAKDVGRTAVERCLASFGPVGECASAHSLHALECFEKVWVAW